MQQGLPVYCPRCGKTNVFATGYSEPAGSGNRIAGLVCWVFVILGAATTCLGFGYILLLIGLAFGILAVCLPKERYVTQLNCRDCQFQWRQ